MVAGVAPIATQLSSTGPPRPPVCEFDHRLNLCIPPIARGLPDLLCDELIEFAVRLLKQEGQPVVG
jgi:hypothetical protein